MDASGQLRNLRDFLLVYNRMTEICFQRCTSNFNYRNLTMDEERCADSCAGKLIRTNHRLMGTYVQLMPAMVQKRMQEMESKAAEMEKAAGALEHPSAAVTDTQPVPPLNPGIPSASPAVEIPATAADHAIAETANLSVPFTSTNEASSSTLSAVAHNTQTLTTTDSLQGPKTVTSVMTSSTVSEGSGSGPAV